MNDTNPALSRTEASHAVEAIGWRYLLGSLWASVPVRSFLEATQVATAAAVACSDQADRHLRVDLRPDRVDLSLATRSTGVVTAQDVELAEHITAALARLSLSVAPPTSPGSARPVQMLEMAIDALDIPAIRPFWKAVMGFVDEPGREGPEEGIVDPAGQLPTIWFQQMDQPRPQRNRIHFDITVAHDEADGRVRAALEAGGTLLDASHARSFWVLADREGNEVCVCTWSDRD